jgi:hypothetical protein
VAGGEGVGHAVVLAGLPDDRVAVVLAAVVDGHPDPQGQGGLPLPDRLAAIGAALVGGDTVIGVEPVEGAFGVPDAVALEVAPLSQADLAALLAHLQHDQDQDHIVRSGGPAPVVAARVRASVGRPGASAHREYQRRRATELAAWTRTLPWRILALVAAGVAAWLAAARVAPNLAAPTGLTVAAGLGWLLRFRTSPDTVAWRRGVVGERRTARLLGPLERHGWAVLHDLAIPNSQANIDCDDPGRGGRGEV